MNRYFPGTAARVAAAYQADMPNATLFDVYSRLIGDYNVVCGSDAIGSVGSTPASNVSSYLFTQQTKDWRYSNLNATHTAELPYVFGPIVAGLNVSFDDAEQNLSLSIMHKWVKFALTGMATSEVLGNGPIPAKLYSMCPFWTSQWK